LLGTVEGVGPGDLAAAAEAKTTVLAMEPPGGWGDQGPRPIVLAPSMRQSPAWLSAADPLQAIGTPRSIMVTSTSNPGDGTLYARLYEALEVLIGLLGVPVTIDASLAGGTPEPPPPDEPHVMTGDLTA